MARKALIVGINTYGGWQRPHACVADAKAMAEVLSRHKDGEKNFDCVVWLDKTDDGSAITRPKLRAALTELFNFDGDVLLYFSGMASSARRADCSAPPTQRRMTGEFRCRRWLISRSSPLRMRSCLSSTAATAATSPTRPR